MDKNDCETCSNCKEDHEGNELCEFYGDAIVDVALKYDDTDEECEGYKES
jgi:hypothetical protein